MALQAAAQKVDQKKPGPKCGFGAVLRSLTTDDYAYYEQMISEARPATFIAQVFRADGHDVSGDKVRRHFRGECSCR